MEKIKKIYSRGIVNLGFPILVFVATTLVAGCGDSDDSTSDSGKTSVDGATKDSAIATQTDASVDDDASADTHPVSSELHPVVFVHGGFGSASQFESQSQRFLINGYPRNYLAAYEHNTSTGAPEPADQIDGLDEIVDGVLADTGAEQVDLIAHSRGGGVCFHYLESSVERAAKVAHYVVVDSATGLSLTDTIDHTPGNVETLALWGEGDPKRKVDGATNISFPDQSHIEMCTAANSFVEMYAFFNGEAPRTAEIEEASGDEIEIAGRVNNFPVNTGAPGDLAIYEVVTETGYRISEEPISEWVVDASGEWGPVSVKKGASYEFVFVHSTGSKHYFYREPFFADDYFVRLNTSSPDGGIGMFLTRTENHSDIVVMRDREFWGDQGEGSDILEVDGVNVITEAAGAREGRLSALFLMDWGPGAHPDLEDTSGMDYGDHVLGETALDPPIAFFDGLPFMSGVDIFMPASSPPDSSIELKLTPRGGDGAQQVVNVPNRASIEVRMSVVFRDFIQ